MKPAGACATKDPRICVISHGPQNWRTIVQDEPGGDWGITGPPYPAKAAALGHVDDVLCDYFGELPTRALLAARIERALAIIKDNGEARAATQLQVVILRVVRALNGDLGDAPEAEPGIREHVQALHPRLPWSGQRDDAMADAHAAEHWRFGSQSHHHGPNAGPHGRPAGWRDGSGVVLIDRTAARRARPLGQVSYPDVIVAQPEDPASPGSNLTLITRVAAALLKAGAGEDEVNLFEAEAGQFTGYLNVLRTARHWVTVTP